MIDVDFMVFDFDGTLVQTAQDIAAALNHALTALGAPRLDDEAVRRYVGDGLHKLIERALGPERETLHARALDLFMEYYDEHLLDTTVLYPGVMEMLEHFRDTRKIIVTNKMESFTLKIARGLAIDGFFDAIIGRDSGGPVKPDQRLLQPFLQRFALSKDRTVVIGDGVNDLLLAKNTGVLSCAFLAGLTDRMVLLSLRPDYCCEDMGDVRALFR
ncbi:MAG: HAD-IA family hydrolase [Syntrophales bacterium]|nr:HAD-IA family hydrolase [Syntrophales bacterium]MCK9527967.1 HAD-IA family hydrolase [Syntrophales bacterium]MDX9921457.1 HAD-IA family hydrolase [Syntrophales bacterium]